MPALAAREAPAAHGTLAAMRNLLRALPNTLWWAVVFSAVLALFTQIAIMVGRFGSVSLWMLLIEFCITIALLALPVVLAWRGREKQSVWFAIGAVIVLAAFARIFFL